VHTAATAAYETGRASGIGWASHIGWGVGAKTGQWRSAAIL
jgi:hypothetical protein